MKIDKLAYLKKHLRTQIRTANSMGSKWVYILTTEAEKCLELAEEKTKEEPAPGAEDGTGSCGPSCG